MPDLVVLTKKVNGEVLTTSQPESAVAGHEVYGWRRAKKSLQAEAEAIHDEATASAAAVSDDSHPDSRQRAARPSRQKG